MASNATDGPAQAKRRWPDRLARVQAVWRSRLLALTRLRYGRGIPDDKHGRKMLLAMLACGSSAPDVLRLAPWLQPDGLNSMIEAADAQKWDTTRLGALVSLTFAERIVTRLWWRPVDVPWTVVQELKDVQKRERDRIAKRDQRTKRAEVMKMAKDLSERGEAVLVALSGRREVSVGELADQLAGGRAWQISEASLPHVVLRTVKALAKRGLVRCRTTKGRTARPKTMVRLVPMTPKPKASPQSSAPPKTPPKTNETTERNTPEQEVPINSELLRRGGVARRGKNVSLDVS